MECSQMQLFNPEAAVLQSRAVLQSVAHKVFNQRINEISFGHNLKTPTYMFLELKVCASKYGFLELHQLKIKDLKVYEYVNFLSTLQLFKKFKCHDEEIV